jgi:hypothetical protein
MQNKAFKKMKGLRTKVSGSLPETEKMPLSFDIGPAERVLFELWESPKPETSVAKAASLSGEDSGSD